MVASFTLALLSEEIFFIRMHSEKEFYARVDEITRYGVTFLSSLFRAFDSSNRALASSRARRLTNICISFSVLFLGGKNGINQSLVAFIFIHVRIFLLHFLCHESFVSLDNCI